MSRAPLVAAAAVALAGLTTVTAQAAPRPPVVAHAYPSAVRPGQTVTLTAQLQQGSEVQSLHVDWGDGQVSDQAPGPCPTPPLYDRSLPGQGGADQLTHTYAASGVFTVTASMAGNNCAFNTVVASGSAQIQVTVSADAQPPAATITLKAPGPVRTGRPLSLRGTYDDPSGNLFTRTVSWGDGSTFSEGNGTSSCSKGFQSLQSFPTRFTETDEHAYRRPGTYRISVRATGKGGCPGTYLETHPTATVLIKITGKALPANGPIRPVAWLGARPKPGHSSALVYAGVYDPDGWGRSLHVDWGDGTTVDRKPDHKGLSCNDNHGRTWPRSDDRVTYLTHHWAAFGKHVVTLTATSTGCDGSAPQTASRSITVTTR